MNGIRQYDFFRDRLRWPLVIAFAAWWVVLAVAPVYRSDWFLENLLVFAGIPAFVLLDRRIGFSRPATLAVFVFLAVHAYGAHYTYSEAPFGFWLREIAGTVRNPYDRLVHFLFGLLLAFPMHEIVARFSTAGRGWTHVSALMWIAALSTFYELMEWAAMLVVAPDLGIAFMGTQGDIFDAHKDSALAIAGAMLALAMHFFAGRRR